MRENKQHKFGKKAISLLLTLSMLAGLLPAMSQPAAAATTNGLAHNDFSINVGVKGGQIGNASNGGGKSIAAEFAGQKSGWSSASMSGMEGREDMDGRSNLKAGAYRVSGDTSRTEISSNEDGVISVLNNDGNSRGDKKCFLEIDLSKIDALVELSSSPTATVSIGATAVGDSGYKFPANWDRKSRVWIEVFNKSGGKMEDVDSGEANGYHDGNRVININGLKLSEVGRIRVTVWSQNMKGWDSTGDPAGMNGFTVMVADTTRPTATLTLDGNGVVNTNETTGTKELLMPEFIPQNDKDERTPYVAAYLDAKLTFSKGIKSAYYSSFKSMPRSEQWLAVEGATVHTLFQNPISSGLKRAGQNVNMVLYQATNVAGNKINNIKDFTADNGGGEGASEYYMGQSQNIFGGDKGINLLAGYVTSMDYRYTTMYGDQFNGNAVPHQGEWSSEQVLDKNNGINYNGKEDPRTFYQKLSDACFYDAAGNYIEFKDSGVSVINKIENKSGETNINPFDPAKGGYNVFIDAVPPTYTKTGNAIQPNILTNMVLTDANTVDFTVNFSEPVITKKYTAARSLTGWTDANTYLQMNNGEKAKYDSGSSTKTWTFTLDLTAANAKASEIPTLKVLALTNEGRPDDTRPHGADNNVTTGMPKDTYTLTDYVGNPLMQKANTENPGADGSFTYEEPVMSGDKPVYVRSPWTDSHSAAAAALTGQTSAVDGTTTIKHGVYSDSGDYKLYEEEVLREQEVKQEAKTSGEYEVPVVDADKKPVYWTWDTIPSAADWNKKVDGKYVYIENNPFTSEDPEYATYDPEAMTLPTVPESQREMITGSAKPYIVQVVTKDGAPAYVMETVQMGTSPGTPEEQKLWYEVEDLTFVAEANLPNPVTIQANAVPEAPDSGEENYTELVALRTTLTTLHGQLATAYALVGTTYTAAIAKSAIMIEGDQSAVDTQVADYTRTIAAYDTAVTNYKTALESYDTEIKKYDALLAVPVSSTGYTGSLDTLTYTDPELAYHKAIFDCAGTSANDKLVRGVPNFQQKTELVTATTEKPVTIDVTYTTITYAPVMAQTETKSVVFEGERYNTKIDWAKLSVDNTEPNANSKPYTYDKTDGSATDSTWGKTGGIQFSVKDHNIAINPLDPTYSSTNKDKPSMGIYRPMNVTGGSDAAATGLVYYVWSKSETLSVTEAEVKQYALAARQPTSLANGDVMNVTNNITQMVTPTSRQLTSDATGTWYLHYWSADMSFDSARQLLQYSKMKTWQSENVQQWIDTYNSAAEVGSKLNPAADVADWATMNPAQQGAALELIVKNRTCNGALPGDPAYKDITYNADAPDEAQKVTYFQWSSKGEAAALTTAMAAVGKYGDSAQWTPGDFTGMNSNWVQGKALIKLDNKAPAATTTGGGIIGDTSTDVTFTVTDGESGVKAASYQYVQTHTLKDDGSVGDPVTNSMPGKNDVNWVNATAASGVYTAVSVGNVSDYGIYDLYFKLEDEAGNISVVKADKTIKVTKDNGSTAKGAFSVASNAQAAAWKELTGLSFSMTTNSANTNTFTAKYIVTGSAERPSGKGYVDVPGTSAPGLAEGVANGTIVWTFPVPKIMGLNNQQYVHITVIENVPNVGPKEYYYAQPYYFDNDKPLVTFNTEGLPYPAEAQSVTTTVKDVISGVKTGAVKYAWVEKSVAGAPSFLTDTITWTTVPALDADSAFAVNISREKLAEDAVPAADTFYPEEDGSYVLYVSTEDNAGNVLIKRTNGDFAVVRNTKPGLPEGAFTSELIQVGGDSKNGFYGIANVEFTADSKEGFQYSVAVVQGDGTPAWSRWVPYTNFLRFTIPLQNLSELQNGGWKLLAKFKAPNGEVTENNTVVDLQTVANPSPVYALVTRDQLKKLMPDTTLTSQTIDSDTKVVALKLDMPVGVNAEPAPFAKDFADNAKTVTEAIANPYPVIKKEGVTNEFLVARNGCYAFKLNNPSDPNAQTKTLLVVVDNFDGEKPIGDVTFNVPGDVNNKTNRSVIATLNANEAIQVIDSEGNLVGKNTVTFDLNGSHTFYYKDEAGNVGEPVIAEVNWINKEKPKAEVVATYTGKTIPETVEVGVAVLAAQGAILTVKNTVQGGGALTITSATGGELDQVKNQVVVSKNGTINLRVSDTLGNLASLSYEVTNLITDITAPTVEYKFVPVKGNEAAFKTIERDGVTYSNGDVLVTVSGSMENPSINHMYEGLKATSADVTVTNPDGTTTVVTKTNELAKMVDGAGMPIVGTYTWSRTYTANGSTNMAISDVMTNTLKVPMKIAGIDKEAPVLTLKAPSTTVKQGTKPADFVWERDLGGYTVTDNVSLPENIKVTVNLTSIMGGKEVTLDLNTIGRYVVTYTAEDELGNKTVVKQNVFVMPGDGMLILGNGNLVAAANPESILLSSNKVNFEISRHDLMTIGGQQMVNMKAKYDIYYVEGLYREGQLKYIATGVTYDELVNNKYTVTFPKAGWYTIIVRNQEREREFTSIFISSVEK